MLGKEDHVCLRRKSLYSLKQSPKKWYLRFDNFMMKHAYNRYSYNFYVYYKKINDEQMIYLLLYVDDMLIICHDRGEINHLKGFLSS